jgi:glucoside 3-dehydrogenase (cytochrome c) hitch-hiker subunit
MRHPIDRRQALRRLGAPAVVPLLKHLHPALPQEEGPWKPRFLSATELESVASLAERIIPETETPGARSALVHQYVDFVLSEGAAADRDRFRTGLAWLDRRSGTLFGKPFAGLESGQQDELLTRLSQSPSSEEPAGVAFFGEARRLSIDGYYRSEAGMTQELGFEGRTFLAEFKGCTHPEHHAWKVGE